MTAASVRAAERGGEAWARAAWSIVAEPGDATAGAVVAALGAPAALAWALWAVTATPEDALRRLRDLARSAGDPGGPAADRRNAAGAGRGEIGASRRGRGAAGAVPAGTAPGGRGLAGTAPLGTAGSRDGTGRRASAPSVGGGGSGQGVLLDASGHLLLGGSPGRDVGGDAPGDSGRPAGGARGGGRGDVRDARGDGRGDACGEVRGGGRGDACGDVRGDVCGDVRGDVCGDVSGDVCGEVRGDARGGVRGDAPGGVDPWPAGTVRVLARALPRWAPRLTDLDPGPALDDLARHGGVLLLPGTPAWPRGLDDLGPAAPLCLWLRGDPDLARAAARSVAVVGARAATAYGERVAADLGAGLAERGVTVVSGGAFGVDVAAHRGALAVGGRTVALLAGGIDRPSPAGNLAVLERIVDDGGALVAESPPGTPPSRARFLQRNRVIAAVTGATVVVEAAWRSGALSTAARAGELLRPVGAVPGPVTAMASVGCHRLLRDGAAVCVTDAAEVVELLDPAGSSDADADAGGPDGDGERGAPADVAVTGPGARPASRVADRADSAAARALDALDRRRTLVVAEVARRSGLGEREALSALGLLELAGQAHQAGGGWRRAGGGHPPRAVG